MNKDQMKAFDMVLEEAVEEIGSEWGSNGENNPFDLDEMQTVGVIGIALQLRRMNNLIEAIRRERDLKEVIDG